MVNTMIMSLTEALITILLGTAAGFINTFAGGGSMLVVPFLIFIGLPANVANATNRVAILFQNIVSVGSFKQKKILDFKTDSKLLLPVALGSIVGAFIAVDINEEIFRKVIAGLLIVMFFYAMVGSQLLGKSQRGAGESKKSLATPYRVLHHWNIRRLYSNRNRLFSIGRIGIRMRL